PQTITKTTYPHPKAQLSKNQNQTHQITPESPKQKSPNKSKTTHNRLASNTQKWRPQAGRVALKSKRATRRAALLSKSVGLATQPQA
ncbi:hypothetical protein, partial [Aquimixticola soesokkakensis]|uniref:hypothetical protein n=1 Tax=Aquimixticola soesokkakensis TaxID=1519096 RepID=UPI001F38B230